MEDDGATEKKSPSLGETRIFEVYVDYFAMSGDLKIINIRKSDSNTGAKIFMG